MSVEKIMKRIGSFMAPIMNFAGSGVSEHPCCSKKSTPPCSYCVDGIGPQQWRLTVSGLPSGITNGVTWDPNGTHYTNAGINPCSWELRKPDLWCNNPPCTRHTCASVTLSGLTLTASVYSSALSPACTPAYSWSKTFAPDSEYVIDGKLDCLAISGVTLTAQGDYADITISAYPYTYTGWVYDWENCECTGTDIYDYPSGWDGEPHAGPSAYEFILDGQSYTLTLTGCSYDECGSFDPNNCWYGLDPYYQYNRSREYMCDCIDGEPCNGNCCLMGVTFWRTIMSLDLEMACCVNNLLKLERWQLPPSGGTGTACGAGCDIDWYGTVPYYFGTTYCTNMSGRSWSLHSI